MDIAQDLIETAAVLLDWGCRKLGAGEGFCVLLVTHHPDGKRSTNYGFGTVEASIDLATRELRTKWLDLQGYVFCYDVTITFETGPERGFLFEAEDVASPWRQVMFHRTRQAADGTWSPEGGFRPLGTREKLIAVPPGPDRAH
jgi:hypothetical protein